MKKPHQNPIDIEKQIENLKAIGLEIKDINYAKQVLKIISEKEKYKDFYDKLIKLTEEYSTVDLKYIGFPQDFNKIICI